MGGMPGMPEMAMGAMPAWGAADFALMAAMWAVMMAAMMLPAAAPMILCFAAIGRAQRAGGDAYVPTAFFVLGYVAAWTGFSLAATLLQWQLQSLALLSPMLAATSGAFGGLLFVAAGLYQLTPLKAVCLRQCRSPLAFVLHHWRDGTGGAVRMGLAHGLYCIGCCWMLMAVLFAVGVMNLLWVAAIALFVLAEKALPGAPWTARAAGAAMIGFGAWLALAPAG
jgi:predicted metal-binding membrane protein